jgi:predicted dienelactone hydrolase
MNRIIRLPVAFWLIVLVLLFAARFSLSEPYKAESGPYGVDSFLLELQDNKRDRGVPIKVYVPKGRGGDYSLVLVSHGLGGSREGLSYLGNHWASHGYVCVHMQHAGSDESVWRGVPAKDIMKAMRKAASTPEVAIDRANDVPFVLNELAKLNGKEGSRLYAMINMDQVAIAGHSFGAWSAMAAGNMTVGGQHGKSFGDERIKCIIPLSPPVAQPRHREATYATLNRPALFMTGTLDTSAINNTTAEERLIPYNLMPGPSDDGVPKYQINFDGADHMTFSGETRRRMRSKVSRQDNEAFHSIILQSTTAFLDCYLLEDADAKKWLNDGGFVALVGKRGDVEMDTK